MLETVCSGKTGMEQVLTTIAIDPTADTGVAIQSLENLRGCPWADRWEDSQLCCENFQAYLRS